ncbi:MAG: hypothetical protein LE178_05370 [Endomicrobium sp.]|nr:hypothetical protein [Endomicrobium sp.]
MVTLLLKGRHNVMTLRLRRCVSLFVCFSLLLSACSPGKSSKASSKVNEFNRITEVDKDSVEKIANHVASAVNKNNVTPVSFWDRELGKVGRFSVTPTKVAIGITTVVVVGGGVWWLGHKKGWWKKSSTQQKGVEVTNANAVNANVGNIIATADNNNVNNRGGGEVSQHGNGNTINSNNNFFNNNFFNNNVENNKLGYREGELVVFDVVVEEVVVVAVVE